jgi:hypothetical protein
VKVITSMDIESATADPKHSILLGLSLIGSSFPSLDDAAMEEVEVFDCLKRLVGEDYVADSPVSVRCEVFLGVNRRLSFTVCTFSNPQSPRRGINVATSSALIDATKSKDWALEVSSSPDRLMTLQEYSTDTYWEADGNDDEKSIMIRCVEGSSLLSQLRSVSVYVDGVKDQRSVRSVTLRTDVDGVAVDIAIASLKPAYVGWVTFAVDELAVSKLTIKCVGSDEKAARLRGLRLLVAAPSQSPHAALTVNGMTMAVFRELAMRVFGSIVPVEDPAAGSIAGGAGGRGPPALKRQASSLSSRVGALLFGQKSSGSAEFQRRLLDTIFTELSRECDKRLGGSGDASPSDDSVFEMVCLLVSITESEGGRGLVASGRFVALLINLLSCATSRVQRQVGIQRLVTCSWSCRIVIVIVIVIACLSTV